MNLVMSINSVSTIWTSLPRTSYTGGRYKYRACDVSAVESKFICGMYDVHLCLACFLYIYKYTYVFLLRKLVAGILRITFYRKKM